MLNCLYSQDNKVILQIKAVPNSSKNSLNILGDCIKINITAPPIENKANEAIQKLLSKCLGVHKNRIQFQSGSKSKIKKIAILETSVDYIENKLIEVING